MAYTPNFLAYFDLGPDTSERDVRRAYARRLKLIDQEADLEGFQELRQRYEAALNWVQHRDRQVAQATEVDHAEAASHTEADQPPSEALVAATIEPEPDLGAESPADHSAAEPIPHPEGLARAVLHDFMAGLQQTPVKERLRALDALDRSLADTRLINLDARAYFEWLLACTLAEGWRPGHEVLFVAVAERFDWVTDQHRLAQFGRAGHFINNAINERLNYDRQSARAREDQRQLILQLRQTEHPGQQRVITNLPHLEHLIRSYPHWLGIIAPVENIQRWREWDAQVPKWRRRFTYQSPAPELASAPEKPMSKKFSWALMLAVLLMSVLGRLSHNQNQSQSPTHRYVEEPSANWQRPSPASVDILDAMSQPHTQPPGNLYPGLPPVSDPLPAESTAARAAPAPAPVQPQTEPAVPHRPYSRETSAALYPELDTTRHFLDPVMPPRPAPAASLPAPIYHLQDTHHDAPEGGPIAPVMPPTDYSLKPAQ